MILPYEHTQPGTLIRVSVGLSAIACIGGAIAFFANNIAFEAVVILIAVTVVLAIILALFHSLTVRVDEDAVAISFGIGIIHKTFSVRDIASAQAVRNSWFFGWGIKRYWRGWLYNVSGLDAVELHFENGKQCRIGTDEPAELLAAIEAALERRG